MEGMMKIEITTAPEKMDIEEIRTHLRQYNMPHLKDIFHTEVMCTTKDDSGNKMGGLVGEVWGEWLIVKFLWVDEKHQGQSIGSQLLVKAENFAKSKGCHSSFLDTFSFQAKPFYERHGYKVKMKLDNFPISGQRYYMVKSLSV